MSLVNGFGGAFLFTNNPKQLAEWYRECLGIDGAAVDKESNTIFASFDYRDFENPEIKRTIAWAIMRADQDIAGKPRTGRFNYTVKNMAETLAHLKSKGVAIEKTQDDEYGKFAWLKDPDGNKIELWEPSDAV